MKKILAILLAGMMTATAFAGCGGGASSSSQGGSSQGSGESSAASSDGGATNEMTRVYSLSELDAHNEYYYDIATGTVSMALASFSEIAVVANDVNAWNGNVDTTWYNDPNATSFEIFNADQLAGFGAIVGGMAGYTQVSFAGKTVKLMADINIGDLDSDNGIVFYP